MVITSMDVALVIGRGPDVSNFIGSDQKVAPYHLVVSWAMTPKSYFFVTGVGIITSKGSIKTANFGKKVMNNKANTR